MLFDFYADPASAVASQANKEEVDLRSVFVGNVSSIMLFPVFIFFTKTSMLIFYDLAVCIVIVKLAYLVLYSWSFKIRCISNDGTE